MKKLFRIFILSYALLLLVIPLSTYAQSPGTAQIETEARIDSGGNVTVLETIGGIQAKSSPTLGNYIRNGYTFAVGAAGIIAVVQLVFAGIQYIYFGFSEGNVGKAKNRATNAIYGLLAILLTYLILQVVNPALVDNTFDNIVTPLSDDIRKIEPLPPTGGGSLGGNTGLGTGGASPSSSGDRKIKPCNDCVDIRAFSNNSILTKQHSNVNRDLANKLMILDAQLDRADVGWRINEAHPPTFLKHKSDCHYNGECIDTGLTTLNVANMNAFSEAASNAGLTANWETTEAERVKLRKAGYTGNFGVISSSPHFHVK